MINSKIREIREFCESNSDPDIIKKYSKYFKEGYDGYGIDKDVAEKQLNNWIERWRDEMTIENYCKTSIPVNFIYNRKRI
jgi:hypothetical protein